MDGQKCVSSYNPAGLPTERCTRQCFVPTAPHVPGYEVAIRSVLVRFQHLIAVKIFMKRPPARPLD